MMHMQNLNKGLPQCLSQILNFDKGSKSSRNITRSKKNIFLYAELNIK